MEALARGLSGNRESIQSQRLSMFDSVLGPEDRATRTPVRTEVRSRRAVLRALLVAGCLLAAMLAAWAGSPELVLESDAELARLLRGMALIKASIVVAVVGALLWRLGRPLSRTLAAVYIGSTAVVAGASMLIWQLTFIPLAAVAFHIGELALLVAAWRDIRD